MIPFFIKNKFIVANQSDFKQWDSWIKQLIAFLTKYQSLHEDCEVQAVFLNISKAFDTGVPQGFILGLLLFLMCINDLTNDLSSSAKLFADDT